MTDSAAVRAARVRRVLWIVLLLNLAVVAVKLAVGAASGALAIMADAFHSVVDSSSNLIGLLAIWIAARPADDNHPYGHYKYESVATFGIGSLLLVAGFEIGRGVFERLAGDAPPPDVTPLTLWLMGLTFLVNVGVTVYETRAGRELHSDLLLADSAHTRADLGVTLSVIGALIAAELGFTWLDPVVAGFVVILLFRSAFDILRSTSYVLTDAAVADPEAVRRIAREVPGVLGATTVRSRGPSDAGYLEVNIQVNPGMGADQAHGVATEVEHRLTRNLPGIVDAVAHVEPGREGRPGASEWENISARLRALADGQGIGLHDLHVHVEVDGRYAVELHLEVPANLTLGQAHQIADEFERRVLEEVPAIASLVTHIEPLPVNLPDEYGTPAWTENLRQEIGLLADQAVGSSASHSVEIHNVAGHLNVTLHVSLPAGTPLVEAHAAAEKVERELHTRIQWLERVVVHVEPPE